MSVLRRSRRIRRTRKGIEVSLPDEERDLLAELSAQLRQMLLDDEDPNLRRLYPNAYDDPRADEEYRNMVRGSLVEGRLAALDTLDATVREKVLTEEQLGCWMGAVNNLRLVLGTRLDVREDEIDFDPNAPDASARAVYHYLGWLLEEIVTVMSQGLPEPTSD
ncbi:MAG TPA: DUF2017 family protein [Acidimicrobiales bacterium]